MLLGFLVVHTMFVSLHQISPNDFTIFWNFCTISKTLPQNIQFDDSNSIHIYGQIQFCKIRKYIMVYALTPL